MALETAKERVELLRDGYSGKEIEMLYVKKNGFKIYNVLDNLLCMQDNKRCASVPFIGLN